MKRDPLKSRLDELRDEMGTIADNLDAIEETARNENRDLNSDELGLINSANDRYNQLETQCATVQKALETKERALARRAAAAPVNNAAEGLPVGEIKAPTSKYFGGAKTKVFNSNLEAFAVGKWISGHLFNNARDRQWWEDYGGDFRGDMTTSPAPDGGAAVPSPMAATIIRLVEEHGVYRRFARPAIMTSGTLDVPKRAAGLTVMYPGEAGAISTSDITFGQVNLAAVKYAAASVWSSELGDDAIISIMDLVATELAYGFAHAEDTNSFLGDGTGTYGGITGIANALNAGSVVTAGGITLGDVTMADFNTMLGKLPQYVGMRPRWFMHSYVHYVTVAGLLQALGGTHQLHAQAGTGPMLLGYPVTFTQVLPGPAAGTGDMVAVLGDLNLGAYSGQRRDIRMVRLMESLALNDQYGLVATMRADSVIHSVGDATNAGAIVALKLA